MLQRHTVRLYLGIALGALALWAVGVPGRTVLTVGGVGLMVFMHAGGHGTHGGHQGAQRSADQAEAGRWPGSSEIGGTRTGRGSHTDDGGPADDARPGGARGASGCH